MKTLPQTYKQFLPAMLGLAALGTVTSASAATVGVVESDHVNAYMAWAGPAGSSAGSWGFADATASYSSDVLTLGAATVNDSNDYWFPGCASGPDCTGIAGDKTMTASTFTEVADLTFAPGETVTFDFDVISNTLVSGYTVEAFIIDFTSDFGFNTSDTLAVTGPGSYSLSHTLSTDPGVNGVTQWGFRVVGANVWSTDVAAQGNIEIATTAVPVPAAAWLFGSALAGLVAVRRKK